MADHFARTLRLNFKKDVPDDLQRFLSLQEIPGRSDYETHYLCLRRWLEPEEAIRLIDVWFQYSGFFYGWKTPRFKDGQLLVLSAGANERHKDWLRWLDLLHPFIEVHHKQIVYRWVWEHHHYEDVLYYDAEKDDFQRGVGQRFNFKGEEVQWPGPMHPKRYEMPTEGPNVLDHLWLWNYDDILHRPRKSAATAPLRKD